MGFPFDHITEYRDSGIAENAIAQLQRRHIWSYLEKVIPQLDGLDILELSKGSGEDAAWLGDSNFNMLATDLSEETLKAAQAKSHQYSMQFNISSHYLELDGLDDFMFTKQFDLIYSDIGSLNQVTPEVLSRLFQKVKNILVPGGRFVAVFVSPFCLSESLRYFFQLKFRKALSRQRPDFMEEFTPAHFYSPATVKRVAGMNFEKISFTPVGIISPPVSMINLFSGRKKLLNVLDRIDRKMSTMSMLARVSDLFIVEVRN